MKKPGRPKGSKNANALIEKEKPKKKGGWPLGKRRGPKKVVKIANPSCSMTKTIPFSMETPYDGIFTAMVGDICRTELRKLLLGLQGL